MITPQNEIADALILKALKLLGTATLSVGRATVTALEINHYSTSVTTRVVLDLGGDTKIQIYLDEPKGSANECL